MKILCNKGRSLAVGGTPPLQQRSKGAPPLHDVADLPAGPRGVPADLQQFYIGMPKNRGAGPKACAERARLVEHHAQQLRSEADPKARELRDIELLTSRLADREMQPGERIPLREGAYEVARTFVGGGSYLALLTRPGAAPKLVCRGTAMRLSATQNWQSGVNNVLREIGLRGVAALWPGLREYLQSTGVRSIEVLGKSQGGAVAQHLALLLESEAGITVDQLTTYCSVGVTRSTRELFAQRVLATRETPFRILVVRNGGDSRGRDADYIPMIGGFHLGHGTSATQCEVEVCHLGPAGSESHAPVPRRGAALLWQFFASFTGAHCRQTTLGVFAYNSISERSEVDTHLAMGAQLETLRGGIAAVLHGLSLGTLNPRLP